MGLTAFTREVGLTEGRVQPTGWAPQDNGSWVCVLGRDDAGYTDTVAVGDSVTVSQNQDFAAYKWSFWYGDEPGANPLALADGQGLTWAVDGVAVTTAFAAAQFADIAAPTVAELIGALNAGFAAAGCNAVASLCVAAGTPTLVVTAPIVGTSTEAVSLTGGSAEAAFLASFGGATGSQSLPATVVYIPARIRPPASMPLGCWWRCSLKIDGTEVVGKTIPAAGPAGGTRDYLDFGCSIANLPGFHTLAFSLQLQGVAGTYEVEVPGFYVDALSIGQGQAAPAGVLEGAAPWLLNRAPEPGWVQVPADSTIALDLVDPGGNGIDLTHTTITVNGLPAYTNGAFQPGFTGPASATSAPQADTTRIVVDPLSHWGSQQPVAVVVATKALVSGEAATYSYSFTAERLCGPAIVSAVAQDQFTILVTYDEPALQASPTGAGDALNPASYAIALGAPGDCAVALTVASVASVSPSAVALTTDIEMTPGEPYRLAAAVRDLFGNLPLGLAAEGICVGWQPPVPSGRQFDLYNDCLPQKNRDEDQTGDLQRFCSIVQEVTNLLLFDCDRFPDFANPYLAPEPAVDAMLADLGFPFPLLLPQLSLTQKRKYCDGVLGLLALYKQKGIDQGIVNAASSLLGLDVTVSAVGFSSWYLGTGRLGGWAPATAVAALAAPYDLADGETLTIMVNGAATTVTFHAGSFANIAAATAAEVAAVLNAAFGSSVPAQAAPQNAGIEITASGSPRSAVRVVGGTAYAAFAFASSQTRVRGSCRLGAGTAYLLNSFDLLVTTTPSALQAQQLAQVAGFMRPSNTHLRNIVGPPGPSTYSPWQLGRSRLGIDALLH